MGRTSTGPDNSGPCCHPHYMGERRDPWPEESLVLGCQDLPSWPHLSVTGDSMWMSRPICPPSTPSPAPQAPLGSRGTSSRKEALCLGRGRPGKASRGHPQAQECVKTLRPWNQGTRGAGQSCLGKPLSPSAPCPLLGLLPAPPGSLLAFMICISVSVLWL